MGSLSKETCRGIFQIQVYLTRLSKFSHWADYIFQII